MASAAEPVTVTPERTALLILDYQGLVVGQLPEPDALIDRVVALRNAVKQAGVLRVYVHVAFRPGYPEVSDRNPMFKGVKEFGLMLVDSEQSAFDPRLTPEKEEVVLTKTRVGAFSTTPLDQILRVNAIETLIIAGVNTSGTVLSTVRDGADRDYELIVVSDCCADPDADLHSVLIEKVLPQQARVVESTALLTGFAGLTPHPEKRAESG